MGDAESNSTYALDAWQLCKNEVLRSGESCAIKAYRNADIRNSKYDNRIKTSAYHFLPHAKRYARIGKLDCKRPRPDGDNRRDDDVQFACIGI